MTLVEMIVQEYRAAVAKHSFFADAAFDDTELELAEQKLKTSRSKIFEEKWNGKIVGRGKKPNRTITMQRNDPAHRTPGAEHNQKGQTT